MGSLECQNKSIEVDRELIGIDKSWQQLRPEVVCENSKKFGRFRIAIGSDEYKIGDYWCELEDG